MKGSLAAYLKDKKKVPFRGKKYYKVSDYKESYYIEASILENLEAGSKEVSLERNSQYSSRTAKGMVKWDPVRGKIMLSQSKIRLYYKPFDVE